VHPMKVRIGEYLVEKGIITAAELELALHRQIIYGGRIGTNLVKLGLISEDVLISLLQVIKNAKGINLRKVGDIAKSVITSMNKETTIKYKCIPFEITGSRMKIASIDALKPEELREIEHLTGKTISLYIFPEIQWIDSMKSYYNFDPSTEENLLKDKAQEKISDRDKEVLPIWKEESRDKEFKKIIEEFDQGIELKSEPAFSDLKEIEAYLESDSSLLTQDDNNKILPEEYQSLDELLSDEDFFTDYRERTGWKRPKVVDRTTQVVEQISLGEATMMLARATNREQVAITMLTLACNYVDDAALFFITPEQIKGWMGMGRTLDKSAIHDFSFSLLSDSFFLDMIKAGSYYCGPVAISNNNRAIFKLINTPWPQEICLFPIIVQNRIVALLYMASYQGEISKQAAVNMQLFIKKSSVSFEILIFRMKSQIKDTKKTEDTTPPEETPTSS
jgi:hypothetical protein